MNRQTYFRHTSCIYINISGILLTTTIVIYMIRDKRNIFSDECSKLDAIYFEMRTNISRKNIWKAEERINNIFRTTSINIIGIH